ncbi:hypothetical protein R302_22015 [Salmonella enterica]|uniref:CaiF/GrlA family transcriptional regulator n=1 Tax=Salmonella enterica TaxID=28901 RepID=A0A634FAJ3_SALER|nr:hypothetical protein [Salmonella enterica subsp. arizonae serovar 63:z4,z23:-]EAX6608069.1 hypothetical protein [Salmonella enterica]EDW1855496.1 hypothetical protein [Salmonella enterica subsp. diarizonae]EAY4651369.1 hypothetical protein [Salmonella enterica]EBA5083465.1 hypothetical protein [Salmonella enterica]
MPVYLLRYPVSGGEWWGRPPDEWTCSNEIAHLGITTLYLAVACWALQLERPVSVSDVCQTFNIRERRASDVLHYITYNARFVEAISLPAKRGQRRMVRVLAVSSPLTPCRQKELTEKKFRQTACKKNSTRECENLRMLRRWFVSRRRGEKAPCMAG